MTKTMVLKNKNEINCVPFIYELERRILYGGGASVSEGENAFEDDEDEQMNISTENLNQDHEEGTNNNIKSFDDILNFYLTAETENDIIKELEAPIKGDPTIILDWESFFLTVVRRSLVRHIMFLLRTWGLGLKIFWQINCIFSRKVGQSSDQRQNDTQSVYVPFRQQSVVYSVLDEEAVLDSVQRSVEELVDKQDHFLLMGSGWAISDYLRGGDH